MALLRSEVPVEQTWNLHDLFETDEAWEKELESLQSDIQTVTQFKGSVGTTAKTLFDCLVAKDALQERVMRVVSYADLHMSVDGTNSVYQENSARAASLISNVKASLSFITSELLALDAETIKAYIKEEPGLQEFQKTLTDILEAKEHTLSPDAEEVLAAFGEIMDSPYMIYQRSKTSDMQFSSFTTDDGVEHPLTFNSFPKYEDSANTEWRRKGAEAFAETLAKYKNTYAATYATEVKKQVIEARLRGYDSVTEMLLEEQEVTQEMYHNQLHTIQTELAPHMRRLAKLKQRVLGLEKMYYSDLKAPLD
ncbi:oligoendopeptidase F, partial [Paenibacillus phytohabitans]